MTDTELKTAKFIQDRNGIIFEPNETEPFTGKYVNNRFENRQKQKETTYKDGKICLITEWFENGQKWTEENYKDGKLNGTLTHWFNNGQKEVEANFKDDKANGIATYWHESGQIKSVENYKDGVLID